MISLIRNGMTRINLTNTLESSCSCSSALPQLSHQPKTHRRRLYLTIEKKSKVDKHQKSSACTCFDFILPAFICFRLFVLLLAATLDMVPFQNFKKKKKWRWLYFRDQNKTRVLKMVPVPKEEWNQTL